VTVIEERFTLLRWGLIGGGLALVPVAILAHRSETLAKGPLLVTTLLGVALALWGLVMKSLRIEIDTATRQVRCQTQSLLSKASETLSFQQIEDVVVRVNQDVSEGSRRRHEEYRLFLVVGSRELPLSRTHTTDLRECERRASELLELLGLEKQGSLLDRSMSHAVVNRRRIEAVRTARHLHGDSLDEADKRVRALDAENRSPGDSDH